MIQPRATDQANVLNDPKVTRNSSLMTGTSFSSKYGAMPKMKKPIVPMDMIQPDATVNYEEKNEELKDRNKFIRGAYGI